MNTLTSFKDGSLGGGPNMSAIRDGSLGGGSNMSSFKDGSLGYLQNGSFKDGSLGRLQSGSFQDGSLGCGCGMKGLGIDANIAYQDAAATQKNIMLFGALTASALCIGALVYFGRPSKR